MPTNSAGRNHKRTKESSLFGTRKLAFYTLYASTDYNMVGNVFSGYSFRIDGTATSNNLTVTTLGEYITTRDVNDMGIDLAGDFSDTDDGYLQIELPFSVTFNDTSYSWITIDSNSAIVFGQVEGYWRNGPAVPDASPPAIFIANNDGMVNELYYETTGSSGTRQFRVKYLGNTDYEASGTNLVWEAVFYENSSNIDVLVTQESTDSADYVDGFGYPDGATWGVTNSLNWIDGRGDQSVTFANFSSIAGENWKLPNSPYYKAVQAIQNAGAEIYWLGTPHNSTETFTVDWSGLFLASNADAFMFAIADDASNPVATLDQTPSYTAVSTGTEIGHNWIAFDSSAFTSGPTNQGIYIGQPVVFSGTTFGGIVAGKKYYVANYANYGDPAKFAITVSETVKSEVLDITYPEGVGGDPGLEVVLDIATGSMTATFYNYDIEWQGTAGDQASSCCFNLTAPGISPVRLVTAVNQSGAFTGAGYFWIERSNPSYGIFPAWWTYTATL